MSNIISIKQPGKYSLRKIFRKKYTIIIFVIVMTVMLVSAYFMFKDQIFDSSSKKKNTNTSASAQGAYIEADTAASKGGYGEGQKLLDDALKNCKTDTERSGVYTQKATLALNNSKANQAVEFATEAEKYNPTRLTASTLALAAEIAGDKSTALKYYKLVVERITEKEREISPDDYSYYQSKVEELSK